MTSKTAKPKTDEPKTAEADGVQKVGTLVADGDTAELTGDGTGEALPPINEATPAADPRTHVGQTRIAPDSAVG